jgi:hypothetical protein
MESFYSKIPAFKDFSNVLNDSHYSEVPDDWYLLLTDVRGSTRAIELGRYKQVNMIGAASITCVLNCLGAFEIPFVFGGDGATLAIPPEYVTQVSNHLKGLQILSKSEYQIELRVGLVPLKLLREQNYILKVAKYELSQGNYLAQFRGGALTRAEEMVKKNLDGAIVLTPQDREMPPNLNGLSCRLDPLKSQKGLILSLICKSRDVENAETMLQDILNRLKFILGDDFKLASPVSLDRLKWKLIPSTFSDEVSLEKKDSSFFQAIFKVLIRVLIANVSLKLNIKMGAFIPKKYKSEIVMNSDFQKFDDMLRMVVDCTPEQAIVIENLLKSNFEKNQIYYGLHKSKEALMTCMVFSASQNQHIHFIDGAQGGYAFAASDLKKQIIKTTSPAIATAT